MSNLFESETLAQYLLGELDVRKRRNEGYSLRAFARDLCLSASRLSEILNNKGGLSEKMAVSVAEKLKLKPAELPYWLDLVLASNPRNANIKSHVSARLLEARNVSRLKELKESQFRLIADWYHTAILELIELRDFKSDPSWVSEQLGIPLTDAIDAICRLKKLGFIEDKDGQWTAKPEAYNAITERPSAAMTKFHQQILHKTQLSLIHDASEERQIQSMIVALPKKHLAQLSERIRRFMQECWEEADGLEKDELYAVNIQVVPVRSKDARAKKKTTR